MYLHISKQKRWISGWRCVEMDLRRKRHLGAGEEERRALELLDRSYSIWKALDGMGSPMR